MECYKYGFWEIRPNFDKGYAFICCPRMNFPMDFSLKRKIYKQFKSLEYGLRGDFIRWVAHTGEQNYHIMKMYEKVGAKPFYKSIKNKVVWFKKELKNV